MSNALDNIIGFFSPQRGYARTRARLLMDQVQARAGYDAAGKGRRNDWGSTTADRSQNTETREQLPLLRSRSREMYRNNPYHNIAVNKISNLVVGDGITAVAKSVRAVSRARRLQEMMGTWASSTDCDYNGRHNLGGLFKLMMRTIVASGEVLAIRRISRNGGAVPLKIQVLEPDHLDHRRDGRVMGNGNRNLIQGIQFADDGTRLGYWIFDEHPGDGRRSGESSRYYPADQVLHAYDVVRPGQVRGVPWGLAAFQRMRGLDDFRDARVEQQKITALLVGFIRQSDENENKMDPDVLPDRLEPGMFPRLHNGEDVVFSSPPSIGAHGDFVRPEEHLIAATYGLTYQELTGDLTQANFASGKLGRISMYQNISGWQHDLFLPQVCEPVESWFLQAVEVSGIPVGDIWFDWRLPRKEILDLKNELPAILREIRSGLNSWSGALRDRGIDPRVLAEEWKEDQELWDQMGLVFDIDPRQMSFNGQTQQAGEQGESDPTSKE